MRTCSTVMMGIAMALVVACKGEQDSRSTSASTSPTSGDTAPARKTDHLEIPAGLSSEHQAAAEQAREAFLTACGSTPLNWDDFKEVSLTTSNASGYLKDRFDWELMVTVTLRYKEGLDRHRSGHRITFDMGAGNRPGIVTRKPQGIELCGFGGRASGVAAGKPCDPEGSEDCFLDVPALAILDAARPAAVIESSRVAPVAWCFGHGFDPPPFWTCTATEKECKKARALEKREENGDYQVRTGCSKTASLHCFAAEIGKTVCAPDAAACTTSRKEWTTSGTATPCEIATAENLKASQRDD